MMYKMTILGCGAAPGVPAIATGWGDCDSNNPKNRRTRTGSYLQYKDTKILIDTSPDLRFQLLRANIKSLDAVLYTHSHADHLHGIDDLREINRAEGGSINFYGNSHTCTTIKTRFPYLIATPNHTNDVVTHPSLISNEIQDYEDFYIKDLKVTPIKLLNHAVPSTGYIFNDGEVVYIADYRFIDTKAFEFIKKEVKLLILPLTTPHVNQYHASLEDVLLDIEKIAPNVAVINHMAVECDYENIRSRTPKNVEPAYDNMILNID